MIPPHSHDFCHWMNLGKRPEVTVTKLGPKHFKTADGPSIKSPRLCKLTPKQRRAQAKCSAIYKSIPNTHSLQQTVPQSPEH